MNQPRFLGNLAVSGALAAVYFVAGKLGLKLAFVHASATAVWPPAGIALAAFLLIGYRAWPGILAGAFLVNLTTAGSAATSFGIAMGNTLEGLIGAYLVNRFARGSEVFDRAQDIFKFAVLAAMASTMVSATCGVTSLSLGGFAEWRNYGAIWLTWWLGDASGDLVVAPLAILWSTRPRVSWTRGQALEAAGLWLCLLLVSQVVFGELFHSQVKNYPLEFLCTPVLIWTAFRFGQREAATAISALAGIAVWGTLHGFGPFVRQTQNESLVLLQAFMGVTGVMTLALAAVVSERKLAEERLQHLSASDSLTGLANYRRLVEVLDVEVKRSQRSGRPFSLLLLDMDGLKKINDTQGHLAGNRALCGLAEVLRANCRAMDTASRFGGDEFALVLPEANEEASGLVAQRISDRLAARTEEPALSASMGIAVYPRDGETIEKLMAAADRILYEMKAQRRRKLPVRT